MMTSYVPNKFTRQEYLRLYHTASSKILRDKLRENKFRDKRIQRWIEGFDSLIKVFYCTIDDLPMYLSNILYTVDYIKEIKNDIIKWRMDMNK